ncbi:glutathione S-transferase family protein [Azospirillum sp. ST 5-10]|uniref:glutathione S-transferase family protein n=1 Tax=unclassified Azospirillum TaxID=2630922 RepID=UPI003F49C58C
MILHDYVLSDDCYKVRLFLNMLGVPYTLARVDVHPGRENEGAEFRAAVNPTGRLPVLTDGDARFEEIPAILTYLALRHDPGRTWLPEDAAAAARVARWLAFAHHDLAPLSALRLALISDDTVPTDHGRARALAGEALAVLDDHLAEREIAGEGWLAAGQPTIADIAAFGTAALAPDAGFALEHYPAVWRWIERMRHLPAFIVIPGIFPVIPELAA